jgi:hypothetical protein
VPDQCDSGDTDAGDLVPELRGLERGVQESVIEEEAEAPRQERDDDVEDGPTAKAPPAFPGPSMKTSSGGCFSSSESTEAGRS